MEFGNVVLDKGVLEIVRDTGTGRVKREISSRNQPMCLRSEYKKG